MAHDAKDELIKAPPTAHRRRDAIARAQYILPVFAVLGVAGFGLGEWLVHREVRYSPGPLASVHRQWDGQCAACHASSQPLAARNWLAAISGKGHVADAQCESCHAGPPHHASQISREVVGCTACHLDHLGEPGKLLAVGDHNCTTCHRELDKHFLPGPPSKDAMNDAFKVVKQIPAKEGQVLSASVLDGPKYQNVSGFSVATHPEFALLRDKKNDPGAIAFNHARHLIPGMGSDPAKPGPFTLAQLSPADRERYRKPEQKADDLPVMLDCRSCHKADATDDKVPTSGSPTSTHSPRGAGATMAPIIYEQHCQACHPLTIDRKIPGDVKSELLTIRHRQQPREILEALQGHYTNLLLKGLWKPAGAAAAPLLPGKPAENTKAAGEIDAQAETATLKLLLDQNQKALEQKTLGHTTCQKCHPSLDPAKGAQQAVPPANIPAVWFQHARFDHTAHRAVDCRECHAQAVTSTSSRDVLLPGIQTCVKCHAPRALVGGGIGELGGARFDCIECHRYHHGDAPLHGRGSRARQPAGSGKSIDDFLHGH